MDRPEELDARGPRLRAALAAVLVGHNPPEVGLVRGSAQPRSGLRLIIAGLGCPTSRAKRMSRRRSKVPGLHGRRKHQ